MTLHHIRNHSLKELHRPKFPISLPVKVGPKTSSVQRLQTSVIFDNADFTNLSLCFDKIPSQCSFCILKLPTLLPLQKNCVFAKLQEYRSFAYVHNNLLYVESKHTTIASSFH